MTFKILNFAAIMTEEMKELKDLLILPKEIAIISHRNPDGDAIGSSLGLAGYLKNKHHNVNVVFPSEYSSTYEFVRGIQQSTIFDLEPDKARKIIDRADLIFCLDFSGLDRIDKLGENVKFSKAKKVVIDHHLDPEPFPDILISDIEASSTCEMIFQVIDQLGDRGKIDPYIGESLFMGIITDTGSFKYHTRPQTYETAAILKGIGVDDYGLNNKIYNAQKERHLRLLGHCLANRMEILQDYGAGIMWLSKKDYQDFDIQRGDTEGIVNYMLMIEKVKMAALILEQPTIVKISLRSKDDVSVQEIAQKHFNGGGHKNAAGGGVYASLKDVINRLKRVIPEHLPKVN